MALELNITSLVTNLTRSARAWRSISTEGASRVSNVGSALVTLLSHRTGLVPKSAPGALGTAVEHATTDLEWLRASVGRLARIEAGAQDALNTLRARPLEQQLTWSLHTHQWVELVDAVADGMRRDLADKRRVLHELERATRGRGVYAERIELYAALWLEQPHLRECVYELPGAVLEAETEAARVSKLHIAMSSPGTRESTPRSRRRDTNLSPAMAMLLGNK